MELVDRLGGAHAEILSDAADALRRADLQHYVASGDEEAARRLDHLLELVMDCLEQTNLAPIVAYGARVANERFEAGFDIAEVQTAFNVLEEAIWRVVVARLPADELTTATGMVTTVLGQGKDALARTWVSLATRRHVPTLDLNALFAGSAG